MAYTQTAEFELASEEYIDIIVEATADYSEGELIDFDDSVGFAIADVDYSVEPTMAAVVQCNKVNALKAAEVMAPCQKLYWDNVNSYVTVTPGSAGSPMIGYVLRAAASADNTVLMSFEGRGVLSLT